jgi:hypothetical protein
LPKKYRDEWDSHIQFIWCIHMDQLTRGSFESNWSNIYDEKRGWIIERCNKPTNKDQNGYRLVINWQDNDYEVLGIARLLKYDKDNRIRIFELISQDENCFVPINQ